MSSTLELIAEGLVGTWDVIRVGEPPEMGTIELRRNSSFSWWWDQTGTEGGTLLVPSGQWRIDEGPHLHLTNFEQPPAVLVTLPKVWRILDIGPSTRMATLTPVQEFMWHRRS